MPRCGSGRALVLAVLAGAALGCATYFPLNERLDRWDPEAGYREASRPDTGRSADLLLILALSGGGLRAAAFSYGVLAELERTSVVLDGRPRRLSDEVDLVSGVSGGSFTAAYFGLYGDALFEDYEGRFLKRNVQLAMLGQLFDPRNWPRLLSTYFERSELAAEYYDRRLFAGATFGDLERRRGAPVVLINATDLSRGSRFPFVQEQFDLLCSDLRTFPVSRAVAASSAVPLLLSPVILRNRAGTCGFEPPAWVTQTLEDPEVPPRKLQHARRVASYLDSGRRPFVHLIDGGISDNLGVRAPLHALLVEEDARRALHLEAHPTLREILLIVVDAATRPDERWDRLDYAPPLATLLDAVTSVQINRYNFETLELLRATFANWVAAHPGPGGPIGFRLVHLSFDAVPDAEERAYLRGLPTSLSLSDTAVDRLRDVAGRLLRQSAGFQETLEALGGRVQAP